MNITIETLMAVGGDVLLALVVVVALSLLGWRFTLSQNIWR